MPKNKIIISVFIAFILAFLAPLIATTHATSNSIQYYYDASGRLDKQCLAILTCQLFNYDQNGNLLTKGKSRSMSFANADFENGNEGWSINDAVGGESTIDNTIHYSGNHSLKVKVVSSGDQYQFKGESYGGEISGRQFSISAYLKTSGITGNGVKILTYWQDKNNNWIWANINSSKSITGTTDWVRVEATAIAPYGAQRLVILVQPTVGSQGYYWLDNIEVKELSSPTILPKNPSFEEGTANWSINDASGGSTAIVSTERHTGDHSLQVKVASSGDQYQFNTREFNTDISGRQFTISAFVKTEGLVGDGVKIWTYWQDENGWIWNNNYSSNKISGTTDWSRLDVIGIAPYGAKKLTVLVQPAVNGKGSYWLDSIQILESPSPSLKLLNPSFEEGEGNWGINDANGGASIIDPTLRNTGKQSLKVKVASSGDQFQYNTYDFGGDISGRRFTISAYVKSEGLSGNGVKILTYWRDEDDWIWSNIVASNSVTGTTDWSRLEVTGIAPTGARKISVLVLPTINGQGYYWVDSIEVKEVVN
ncbi:hypothetical protein GC101_10525 [Paenibacillus sp. LMG 31459]|uniref:Mannanase galactose-binding domain-containing protein n=1 Tax=Paenibacillus phytohabitans TaxID=2654978 RepID=A0ABX1YEV6_9BACL|nr:hypothetical protein [Paenibacillus phytohabitans]NOU79316.1 hypothetical protein [Paenibacillus phytohabitans]